MTQFEAEIMRICYPLVYHKARTLRISGLGIVKLAKLVESMNEAVQREPPMKPNECRERSCNEFI